MARVPQDVVLISRGAWNDAATGLVWKIPLYFVTVLACIGAAMAPALLFGLHFLSGEVVVWQWLVFSTLMLGGLIGALTLNIIAIGWLKRICDEEPAQLYPGLGLVYIPREGSATASEISAVAIGWTMVELDGSRTAFFRLQHWKVELVLRDQVSTLRLCCLPDEAAALERAQWLRGLFKVPLRDRCHPDNDREPVDIPAPPGVALEQSDSCTRLHLRSGGTIEVLRTGEPHVRLGGCSPIVLTDLRVVRLSEQVAPDGACSLDPAPVTSVNLQCLTEAGGATLSLAPDEARWALAMTRAAVRRALLSGEPGASV